MIKKWTMVIFGFGCLLYLGTVISTGIYAQDNDASQSSKQTEDELKKKQIEIEELKAKLSEVQGQKQTLASTIGYLNNKIALTQAQINQTQDQLNLTREEIASLSLQIDQLDASLDAVSHLLINRIRQTYIRSRINPFQSLMASQDLPDLLKRYKYLQLIQRNDRRIMYQMETTRLDFDKQKKLKQEKELELDELNDQLEDQQQDLAQQQKEKERLLEITRNDEKRFQSEIAQKRAEMEAIQSIIAGKGDETEVGSVKAGDKIANVIPGRSTCSSGAHLHLEVAQNGVHKNPADYLTNKSVIWDNGPDSSFNFSGSWQWPLNDSVRITQGYGMTFYAATMRYYGGGPHTGIDMVNKDDYSVKAIADGTLYRGGMACGGGTLRYVKVEHSDSVSSFYLHVNY